MSDYVISIRNVSKGSFGTEPGATQWLEVPDSAPDTSPTHKISRAAWVDKVLAVSKNGTDPVTGENTGDILVFVHGYNNSTKNVLARHRLLKKNLAPAGFQGGVVSFDWPSNDIGINYLEDRSDARKTALKLVDDCIRLFAATQMRGCDYNVHLLAHSTGAYVIREGFDDADDRRHVANTNWSASQVVFIGADVSSRSMSADDSKSSSVYRHCVRLTNYQNPYDSVLKLSNIKRVGVAPRVGRTGLPDSAPGKAVNVNCGPYFSSIQEKPGTIGAWDHSWHFDDPMFAKDLAHTLAGDIDRNYIPTRQRDGRGELVLTP
ncbi:MAG: alpha/beta hydrolase [Armatimonadetes bacterium]|nr:MAG: alpha/beta hydrolase [Armatimonadota bacterium]